MKGFLLFKTIIMQNIWLETRTDRLIKHVDSVVWIQCEIFTRRYNKHVPYVKGYWIIYYRSCNVINASTSNEIGVQNVTVRTSLLPKTAFIICVNKCIRIFSEFWSFYQRMSSVPFAVLIKTQCLFFLL